MNNLESGKEWKKRGRNKRKGAENTKKKSLLSFWLGIWVPLFVIVMLAIGAGTGVAYSNVMVELSEGFGFKVEEIIMDIDWEHGTDEVGKFYREDLIKNNVKPILLTSSLMSGCCIVLITPDGERTFCTYLGAAADLHAEDIRKEAFVGYDICHVEGYLVQDHDLIETALRTAKEQGCTVSLDLASYNVVNDNHQFLKDLIYKYVDIVFANEGEARAFTGSFDSQEQVRHIAHLCDLAVVKLGENGSVAMMEGGRIYQCNALPVSEVVDTTAAGDYFAAGFLHALTSGHRLKKCLQVFTKLVTY